MLKNWPIYSVVDLSLFSGLFWPKSPIHSVFPKGPLKHARYSQQR